MREQEAGGRYGHKRPKKISESLAELMKGIFPLKILRPEEEAIFSKKQTAVQMPRKRKN